MLDIIILAALAIFIAIKFFNMLGKDADDTFDANIDPLVKQFYKKNAQQQQADIEIVSAAEAALPQHIRDVFDNIRRVDANFSADLFIKNAKSAFVMILQAFADGDKQILKKLLSNAMFKDFATNIDARTAQKQTMKKSIIGINNIEVIDAHITDNIATITIQVISDQITVLSDYLGNTLDGNNSIVTHNDTWAFERNIKRDKVWFLTATNSVT